MVAITLLQAKDQLDAAVAALTLARQGSYSISTGTGSRASTPASVDSILKDIAYWRAEVERLSPRRGPSRVYPA
ncbi:DUF6148 family protein [Acuticoccus mangrovi]|uniref:Uncharacterized protein n=1 Tax=Acuticoccus mangrovi TaxID=2796142 RepID=A0A934IM68_9HYPH|nr:DUF6148 family protein [Acuticoccus mangrovi]MBJ3776387.1 hypothetical protein [Acuticoccus mangrovi]